MNTNCSYKLSRFQPFQADFVDTLLGSKVLIQRNWCYTFSKWWAAWFLEKICIKITNDLEPGLNLLEPAGDTLGTKASVPCNRGHVL